MLRTIRLHASAGRVAVATVTVALLSEHAGAQPFGIDARAANTTLLIDEVPIQTNGPYQLANAFPQLGFNDALGILEAPDGSGRLFVIERAGRILTFPKGPDPAPASVATFLDITDRVTGDQGELGLLGLAFDPNYATSGEIYVHYTTLVPTGSFPFYDADSVIARFTNDVPSDDDVSSATEEILMTVDQPFDNHNGGTVAFGPDDYLYIALGDGGADPFEPYDEAIPQDTTDLLGSVLRIDVNSAPDPGLAYAIPPSNPFAGGTGPDPATREEIYAYGLRNPYRCAFDTDGTLYCGDVGDATWEEINVIEAGGNYGWPIMEGDECFDGSSCDPTGLTLPIDQRANPGESIAILGGHVFRSSRLPELVGTYVYADFVTGLVWGLNYDGSTATNHQVLLDDAPVLFSLGNDADGEVYLVGGDTIFRLEEAVPTPAPSFPTALGDLPALHAAGSGTDQTGDGIFPYAPQSALWSDGTIKERFLALPGTTEVGYTASGGWDFPADTVIVKNFLLPQDFRDPAGTALRIETRLLVRNGGSWYGFSYEWDGAETDATLLPGSKVRGFSLVDENGDPFSYAWVYPSRNDCTRCHTDVANNVLGLSTAQMNHDFDYPASGVTDNQLRTFEHIGLFDAPLPDLPDALPRSPDAFDLTATVEDRTMSYLNANCAMCHQPGGPTNASMDLRWQTPLAGKGLVDALPTNGDLGVPGARIVLPGDPDASVLALRMEALDDNRMPPLATSRVHDEATTLVRSWIASLSETPSLCPDQPQTGCFGGTVAGKARLQFRNLGDDDRDRVGWNWKKGEAFGLADLGDPLGSTLYAFCLYDQTSDVASKVAEFQLPLGAGWKAVRNGFKYRESSDLTGKRSFQVKSGSNGRTKLQWKASGAGAGPPALPLDQDSAVVAQFTNSEGACWESVFDAGAQRNDSESFKAKGD